VADEYNPLFGAFEPLEGKSPFGPEWFCADCPAFGIIRMLLLAVWFIIIGGISLIAGFIPLAAVLPIIKDPF
jgi:hypothetical protein